jgi:hypothetical protein
MRRRSACLLLLLALSACNAVAGRQALLLATHLWDADLRDGVHPILDSAMAAGLDAHIYAVGSGLAAGLEPPPPPGARVHRISQKLVAATYPHYLHAHISNHFNVMRFWRTIGRAHNYSRVWCLEFDVRAAGNISLLWQHGANKHYVSSTRIAPLADRNRYWARKFRGGGVPRQHFWAQKQVIALSASFLDYLDDKFTRGNNGQDEATLATFAMAFSGPMGVGDLSRFLAPSWSYDAKAAPLNRARWREMIRIALARPDAVPRGLQLFHPVKPRLPQRPSSRPTVTASTSTAVATALPGSTSHTVPSLSPLPSPTVGALIGSTAS